MRLRLGPRSVTLALGAAAIVAAALVAGAVHHAPPLGARAQAEHDRAAVAATYHGCHGIGLPRCDTRAVWADGPGGLLVAVEIRPVTGDDCYRGLVYFFAGERRLGASSRLAPFSRAGVVALSARADGSVVVGYALSPSSRTSCAANGSAGVDDYRYALQGGTVIVVSGRPPRAPEVIVGSRGD